jgi:hypothetical protein
MPFVCDMITASPGAKCYVAWVDSLCSRDNSEVRLVGLGIQFLSFEAVAEVGPECLPKLAMISNTPILNYSRERTSSMKGKQATCGQIYSYRLS